MEPLYQSLSEQLQRNHEMWLAREGNPDGVSSNGEEEPLPDLSYPPQDGSSNMLSTGEESFNEMVDRWVRLFEELGRVHPVPEYPEPPCILLLRPLNDSLLGL